MRLDGRNIDDATARSDRRETNQLSPEGGWLGIQLSPLKLWQQMPRLRHQLKLQCHWWLKRHQPYQPVFVLATPRSGSNLVVDYLNRLPNVHCQWEVLCAAMPEGPSEEHLPRHRALRHIRYSLQALGAPIRGCKFLLYQLAYCNVTPGDLDAAFPDSKYIVLYRQSLVEQYVSLQSAVATNQWVLLKGQEPRRARVTVDMADLRRHCEMIRRDYQKMLSHPALQDRSAVLSYEEVTEDPASCLRDKICPLLGVPAVEPKTGLCKQNPQPLAERVTNYSQVAALMASPLCWQQYHLPSQVGRHAA
jgi:LPS sulfotransferase NodH